MHEGRLSCGRPVCLQSDLSNTLKSSSRIPKEVAGLSQPRTTSLAIRRTESLELRPSLLKIIVDNDLIMHTRSLRVRNLVLSLLQTRQNRFLAVRSAAPQPLLQDLDGRRLQEEEARVEIRLLDLLDAL